MTRTRICLLVATVAALVDVPASWALGAGDTLLFKDDFTKPTKLWGPGTDKYGSVRYVAGTLHIAPTAGGTLNTYYNRKIATLTSMHVAADTWKVSGIAHNNMAVSCATIGGAYEFVIGSNGLVGIARLAGGETTALKLINSKAAVRAGRNHIDGWCQTFGESGPTILTMSVNGKQLIQVSDQQPLGAFVSVGLHASARDPGKRVEVGFDKVRVYQPTAS